MVMKKVLTLITVALLLGACGQKQNTSRTAGRNTSGGNAGPNGNVSSTYSINSGWSAVTGFNRQGVVDLVSTNPNITVGNIDTPNCTTLSGQACAIVFNVSANPGAQTTAPLALNTSTSTYTTTGTGMLTIGIYDSLTGNGTSAIAVAVPLSAGQVIYQGNTGSAYIVFGDGAGTITVGVNGWQGTQNNSMVANIQGQNFFDTIAFTNTTGSNFGSLESLGNFTTNVCGIFQCYN
jgi:hypothetical protein